jgi:hypothetical protein
VVVSVVSVVRVVCGIAGWRGVRVLRWVGVGVGLKRIPLLLLLGGCSTMVGTCNVVAATGSWEVCCMRDKKKKKEKKDKIFVEVMICNIGQYHVILFFINISTPPW